MCCKQTNEYAVQSLLTNHSNWKMTSIQNILLHSPQIASYVWIVIRQVMTRCSHTGGYRCVLCICKTTLNGEKTAAWLHRQLARGLDWLYWQLARSVDWLDRQLARIVEWLCRQLARSVDWLYWQLARSVDWLQKELVWTGYTDS